LNPIDVTHMRDMEDGIYLCPRAALGCFARRRTTLADWAADAACLAQHIGMDVEVYLVQEGTPVGQTGSKPEDLATGKSWTKIHHVRRDGVADLQG